MLHQSAYGRKYRLDVFPIHGHAKDSRRNEKEKDIQTALVSCERVILARVMRVLCTRAGRLTVGIGGAKSGCDVCAIEERSLHSAAQRAGTARKKKLGRSGRDDRCSVG